MNTGIGDAVDLGWKLAATLSGWGGPELLASYDAERRPIGLRNVGMAAEFYLAHGEFVDGIAAIEDDSEAGRQLRRAPRRQPHPRRRPHVPHRGLQLGYRYEASPICIDDGTAPSPDDPEKFVPSARPGSRAPHALLADGRSTLDLFGRGFVLLRFGDAPTDALEQCGEGARRAVDGRGNRRAGGRGALREEAGPGAAGRARRVAGRCGAARYRQVDRPCAWGGLIVACKG